MPASVLALGRGQHRISGCVFEDNAPPPGTSLNQSQVGVCARLGAGWRVVHGRERHDFSSSLPARAPGAAARLGSRELAAT